MKRSKIQWNAIRSFRVYEYILCKINQNYFAVDDHCVPLQSLSLPSKSPNFKSIGSPSTRKALTSSMESPDMTPEQKDQPR